ncbi:MAG: tRNA glutamyl-Q(34) synthetase GluQRS [Gammaproteobacteria bacterium]|jgi:glutamyl-Q tRNA(Asp) synthetase
MPDTRYRGRFAPSPTGPLHLGSLIAATASYLQARHQGGEWWVRIEDIDPPREVAGASDMILRTLEAFGFEWDGPVSYQSCQQDRYRAALAQLQRENRVYACGCSRKDLATAGNYIYPGTCREGLAPGRQPRSWRLRVPEQVDEYVDAIQGLQRTEPATELGDFVLWRADGYVAYQLATALDDAEQGMTEVVRGADLLDSTPRQRLVQQALGLPSPAYAHHPVVTGANGYKLSKQNRAPPLDSHKPTPQLHAALRFLGQAPPMPLQQAHVDELWAWARANWDLQRIPAILSRQIEKLP